MTSLVPCEQELAQLKEAQARRNVRAACWSYIFACFAAKKGGPDTAQNDGKEIQSAPATPIIPQSR